MEPSVSFNIDKDKKIAIIKDIKSIIKRNFTTLNDDALANWFYEYGLSRLLNHIDMVIRASKYYEDRLVSFGFELPSDKSVFRAHILKHDADKLALPPREFAILTVCSLIKYNKNIAKLVQVDPSAISIYESQIVYNHIHINMHHPECWGYAQINKPYPVNCVWESLVKPGSSVETCHQNMFCLIEMVCDWIAVGIEQHDSAKQWWDTTRSTNNSHNSPRWIWCKELTQFVDSYIEHEPYVIEKCNLNESSIGLSELPQLQSEVGQTISTEKIDIDSKAKLTKSDDKLWDDRRYVKLLFMLKYVCKVEGYINPDTTFKDMKVTSKKYDKYMVHVKKHFYLGEDDAYPKFDANKKFKEFVRSIVDHLKDKPKEEDTEEASTEGLLSDAALSLLDKFKHMTKSGSFFTRPIVREDNTYYNLYNFPFRAFEGRCQKVYKTIKIGRILNSIPWVPRSAKLHRFFVPELLYMLKELNFSNSLINEISENTWYGEAATVSKTKVNTSLINKNMNCELYPHQIKFINEYGTLKDTTMLRGYLLSFEQGLGKTITSLALMESLSKDKVIIICPKNTMVETWKAHIEKFYNQPQKIYMAHDSKIAPDTRFYIVNYEAIEKLDTAWFANKRVGIIIDESHNFLRMGSDRTQNLINLCNKMDPDYTDILPMSGTPLKHTGIEMIPMLYLLDPFFDNDAFLIFKNAFGFNGKLGVNVLNHRLSRMMFREAKDILNLPNKTESTIMVRMNTGTEYTVSAVTKKIKDFIEERQKYHEQNMDQYNKAFDRAVDYWYYSSVGKTIEFKEWLNFVTDLRRGGDLKAYTPEQIARYNEYENKILIPMLPMDLRKDYRYARAAVKYLYMKIRGEVLGGLLTRLRQQMTSEMLEAARIDQYVEQAEKKTVIFSSYVDTIEIAGNYFKKLGYEPSCIYGKTANELTDRIKEFQTNPKINPLIASLKMLSTGATLTAANTVIFLNKPWRSIEYQQASDRVHRIGQDTDVNVISLVLDTGNEANLSTRMEDIMNTTAEMFDALVDNVVSEEDLKESTEPLLDPIIETISAGDEDEPVKIYQEPLKLVDPSKFKKDKLSINQIDTKYLNMEVVERLSKYENYLEMLKRWMTVPDYTLVGPLSEFGEVIDQIYHFNKRMTAYRAIRVGTSDKPVQNNMGLIDVTELNQETNTKELTPKEGVVPGFIFNYTTQTPMSVTRSIWISKVYGDLIMKTMLPADCKKLVITNELAYVLQRLDTIYPQYRPINLSCRTEVIVFPGQTLKFKIVTINGDISSELPEFKRFRIPTLNEVEGYPSVSNESLDYSIEAVDNKINSKKANIINTVCKIMDTIDPSKTNSKRYHTLFDKMSDKDFDKVMEAINLGDWQFDIILPNLDKSTTTENILAAADKVGTKLMHRIWMKDNATGRRYLTDNEYLTLTLPVRRMQQFIDEKMSIPDDTTSIDAMSGQVTGDDRSCSVTNPEIQNLMTRGLDRTLQELVTIRGGNIQGFNEFNRSLEETGHASLDAVDPNSRTRIAVITEVYLKSMMIDNNMTER